MYLQTTKSFKYDNDDYIKRFIDAQIHGKLCMIATICPTCYGIDNDMNLPDVKQCTCTSTISSDGQIEAHGVEKLSMWLHPAYDYATSSQLGFDRVD